MILFIFRRDLRLKDNTALIKALEKANETNEKVCLSFIFTPIQVDKNDYKSSNCIQFMVESLKELDKSLKKLGSKLHIFYGNNEDVLDNLIKQDDLKEVYVNVDYTPFSKERDNKLKDYCLKKDIKFNSFEDSLLFDVEKIKSNDNKNYTIFGFFEKKAIQYIDEIEKPKSINKNKKLYGRLNESKYDTTFEYIKKFYDYNPNIATLPGRKEGLKILKNIKNFKEYSKTRNDPNLPTTMLSAHNKFGTLSIREVFHSILKNLGKNHQLISQLIWRDFYYNIAYYKPSVFGNSFNNLYPNIKWKYNENNFKKWCSGETGYPFVDAGMRQLNETGWMHNRLRMVVAQFLTKNLGIDWKLGEKYFATKLVDYDPIVNNGNWQWNAGTGTDPERYGKPRFFNPWNQSERFDPNGTYIKKWIKELKDIPASDLHKWEFKYNNYNTKYPKPMVDYKQSISEGLEMYQKGKKN